ncbi:hypothetical protein DFH06DRAFT_1391418 [Mycena polygramma]|nr:hypothetical protein DFH06DRAFT_1391418 [Mycena polygramma]
MAPSIYETPDRAESSSPGAGATPRFQTLVIVHALICVFGFAVCLPSGVILARYLRTFRPWWYTGHWIAQFALGDNEFGDTPSDDHKMYRLNTLQRWGTAILVLYLAQCALGVIIHFWKPKNATRRPAQNYLHAVVGLVVIAAGMAQIRTGYNDEWPAYMGRGRLPNGVNILWIVWCIVIVVAYVAGMAFIRKQYRQEAAGRRSGAAPSSGGYEPAHNMVPLVPKEA